MNKENKLLLIFAGVFLVIGLVGSLLISSYSNDRIREKVVTEYQELIPAAHKVEIKKHKNEYVKTSYKFFNEQGTDLGIVYIGEGVAVGIDYYALGENEAFDKNQKYLFKFEVYVRTNNRISAVRVVESEHTPDFVEYVTQYFDKLVGQSLIDYKLVDEVAGASRFTMPIVREVLYNVTKIHLDEEPTERPDLEPHEVLFGEGSTLEDVDGFVGNEKVIGKKEIKDAEGVLLGYGYVGKSHSEKAEAPGSAPVTIMIAVDDSGKIIGILTVDSKHTPGFYNNYASLFDDFINTDVSDLALDEIVGSTISGEVLNDIIDAVKEVILNE